MRVLSARGARTEAGKMAPVPGSFARHRQLPGQLLDDFDIRPDYDLHLMRRDRHELERIATSLLKREGGRTT